MERILRVRHCFLNFQIFARHLIHFVQDDFRYPENLRLARGTSNQPYAAGVKSWLALKIGSLAGLIWFMLSKHGAHSGASPVRVLTQRMLACRLNHTVMNQNHNHEALNQKIIIIFFKTRKEGKKRKARPWRDAKRQSKTKGHYDFWLLLLMTQKRIERLNH